MKQLQLTLQITDSGKYSDCYIIRELLSTDAETWIKELLYSYGKFSAWAVYN